MRVIVAGSRTIDDYEVVCCAICESGFVITTVVSGCAKGVDQLGERWALEHGVPVDKYPAQWASYGNAAGPIRNQEMSENSEALVAIWNGMSRGTAHMIDCAKKKGLKVFVFLVE